MLFDIIDAVRKVSAGFFQTLDQSRDALGFVLQIIINRDNDLTGRMLKAAHERIVLAEVPHQSNAQRARSHFSQSTYYTPRVAWTTVINCNHLSAPCGIPGECRINATHQLGKMAGITVNRNDNAAQLLLHELDSHGG
jgi:hypothetical protein